MLVFNSMRRSDIKSFITVRYGGYGPPSVPESGASECDMSQYPNIPGYTLVGYIHTHPFTDLPSEGDQYVSDTQTPLPTLIIHRYENGSAGIGYYYLHH